MATKQKFAASFNTDNAAFADGQMSAEVARVLRDLADTIEENGLIENGILRIKDANGARIGFAALTLYHENDT